MEAQKRGRGRTRLYQWSEWFGCQGVELSPGKDFYCRTESFIQQVRSAASARQIRVSIFTLDGKVLIWNHSHGGTSGSIPDSQVDSFASQLSGPVLV